MKLILGTMTFGPQVNLEAGRSMVQIFFSSGNKELDTAYVYNNGETEKILGKILSKETEHAYYLGTKVNPRITGKLDAEAVYMQINESLSRLGRDSVDLLYFHFPDPNTPIESALGAMNYLHKQGKIKEFGLSNFPADMVEHIWYLCDKFSWLKPTVYQGLYNGLSRKVEKDLLPLLHRLGIRFYAYNPLAGGLLSGKYSNFFDNPLPGRFTYRPNYLDRYWRKSFFKAMHTILDKCRQENIHLLEGAFRWLAYHSCLDDAKGDGIIIGASKIEHLKQNLETIEKGELPESIVDAFNEAWEIVKADSPEYYRFIPKKI